jgi:hypothetical protein
MSQWNQVFCTINIHYIPPTFIHLICCKCFWSLSRQSRAPFHSDLLWWGPWVLEARMEILTPERQLPFFHLASMRQYCVPYNQALLTVCTPKRKQTQNRVECTHRTLGLFGNPLVLKNEENSSQIFSDWTAGAVGGALCICWIIYLTQVSRFLYWQIYLLYDMMDWVFLYEKYSCKVQKSINNMWLLFSGTQTLPIANISQVLLLL